VTVVLEARGSVVAVAVRDSGRGFEESELENVFTRGFRGRASGASRSSRGLAATDSKASSSSRRSSGGGQHSRQKKRHSSRGSNDSSADNHRGEAGSDGASAAVAAVGGSGLGLAIARDLMRASGGDVTAANDSASGGAIVTITALCA